MHSCLEVLQTKIKPGACPTIRGKLGWLCSTCAPHLAVVSRVDDDVLMQVGHKAITKTLQEGPPLILHSLDLHKTIHIQAMMDSSMESRQITKLQARESGLYFVQNDDAPLSLISWYSRLHRRKA
eukprot:2296873-Alexandrium_andersonii.AAC.1